VSCDKSKRSDSKETRPSNCKRGSSNQLQNKRQVLSNTRHRQERRACKEGTQLQGNVFLSLRVSYISIDCNLSRVGSSMHVWCVCVSVCMSACAGYQGRSEVATYGEGLVGWVDET